jgi:1-deoxy-D-xylulose-5-phosphate reductoisomerase
VGALTFFAPDVDKFPCLRLARAALERGGSAPVVLNAANEIAVAAFLERRIGFTTIAELIERALDGVPQSEPKTVDDCVAVDGEARRMVEALIGGAPAAVAR